MSAIHQDSQRPPVDLTMMKAFHAALRRDLERLSRAARGTDLADSGRATSVRAGWEVFGTQLHRHHTGEDRALWPLMRARLGGRQYALDVLDDMEEEHIRVGTAVERVEASFSQLNGCGSSDLPDAADTLVEDLSAHLAHEERDALPLIGETLTQQEWQSIMAELRRSTGFRGAAELFPWLLEASDEGDRRRVMQLLPPPLQVVYRAVWAPRYKRRHLWGPEVDRPRSARGDTPANPAQSYRSPPGRPSAPG